MSCLPPLSLRAIAIAAILAASLWCLWRVYRSPNSLDPVDLVVGEDGKASWSKLAAIGCFLVVSWAVVVVAIAGRLSDGVLLGYAAVYSGTPVAFQLVNRIGKREGDA